MQNCRKILVGKISSAHSIKGEVKIHSYCFPQDQITTYTPLINAEDQEFKIARFRMNNDIMICKLEGVDDRNAAEALKGTELFTYRSQFAPEDEEEFYIEDLKNLTIIDLEGQKIGTVVAVHNYGADDILEILLDQTEKTELVAFTKEFFPEVNLASQTISCSYKL